MAIFSKLFDFLSDRKANDRLAGVTREPRKFEEQRRVGRAIQDDKRRHRRLAGVQPGERDIASALLAVAPGRALFHEPHVIDVAGGDDREAGVSLIS